MNYLSCYLDDSRLILPQIVFTSVYGLTKMSFVPMHSFEDQGEMVISTILIHVANMPTYVVLINWTDQGLRNVNDSPSRFSTFKTELEKAGGKVIDFYYTAGQYDGVAVLGAPDDGTMMSVLMSLGSKGNVRTTTLKSFTMEEGAKVISELR